MPERDIDPVEDPRPELDYEQIRFAIRCFAKWVEVRNDEGNDPVDFGQLECDIEHSGLLHWLLGGNPPMKSPPPKQYAYPCYDLGEGNKSRVHELNTFDDGVLVDGCGDWAWEDKDKGVLKHTVTGDLYQLSGNPRDKSWRVRDIDVVDFPENAVFIQKIKS